MRSRSGSLSSPTLASLTGWPRAAPGLSRRSPTNPTLGTPRSSRSHFRPTGQPLRPPAGFSTKIFNRGVEAAIQIHFRASKVKQYFKEGRALRTETTVNDTRDFGIGRLLTQENWNALIDIGHQINQRFLDHQLDA